MAQNEDLTPGQQAAEAIRMAKLILADPAKVAFHERLTEKVAKLERELAFWREVGMAMAILQEDE